MKIKKLISFMVLTALFVMTIGPAVAVADTSVSTGFTRSAGGGEAPIVKVKWEMNDGSLGLDDATRADAQFMPSGQYQVNKQIEICSIVTDPDGVSDIDSVYGNVYYPTNVYLGDSHEADRQGCGQEVGTECRMTQLSKTDGIELFCNQIRNNNNNLPTWADDYNYDEVCAEDGELMKETAYVYCCTKELSYEDPSGDYRTLVFAQDSSAVDSNYLENFFEYMNLTSFEVDFNAVQYGSVKLNTHKIINGDLTWNIPTTSANPASVRNVGNTRLQMSVSQNDMGLGKTGTGVNDWNVKYDGRVGSSATWKNYWPEALTWLNNDLDLSEMDEMDFSILITKFPPSSPTSFTGTMDLGAKAVSHLTCP